MNASDLRIWNNAAFDDGESEDTSITRRSSFSPLKPIFVNQSDSLDSFSSKENQSPVKPRKPFVSSVKTPAPVKSIHPKNGVVGNSQAKPTKPVQTSKIEEEVRDEAKIDAEIEEIQAEITRLSSRLEALRLEKAEQRLKILTEKRGRVVPAKFMEQKKQQSVKNPDGVKKKIEEMSGGAKLQRQGFSLGPSEIAAGVRRGVSLGPAEIVVGVKSRQLGKQEIITPVQSIQNRRKSCFWKLQEIEEEKVITKERGKSSSISPKSRRTISKTQPLRLAATTIGSKKGVRKDDAVISGIRPKNLFKDGEKSVPKKALKPGRVVASRYSQNAVQSCGNSALRKRSFPESDDGEKCEKKRASSIGTSWGSISEIIQNQGGTQNRVKKRWEIPGELVVVHRPFSADGDDNDEDESPVTAAELPEILPKIKTVRRAIETPRDSGPAKRVAELIGKKSFFNDGDEKVEQPVCQALSFADDFEDK